MLLQIGTILLLQIGASVVTNLGRYYKLDPLLQIRAQKPLRIFYKCNISSFEELTKRDKSFAIHQANIQLLAIYLFKTKGNL